MTDILTAALRLAALGYHVFPIAPGGKEPLGALVPSGHLDATTDAVTIQQWWALYPDANIGEGLTASELVVVAPDCPERLADFERRGLPATMVVQSGGGEGHRHYYYRRPAGCPQLRICKSQDYDVISDGYAIAAPSITNGPYTLLTDLVAVEDLPAAPAWVVAMLTNEQQRRDALPVLDAGGDDEPPVRLSPEACKRWTGTYYVKKRDGTPDRSESLWVIAKDLARAGAMPRTIARALLERDAALGWKKYAIRSDSAARALRDAVKACAEVAAEGTPTSDPMPAAQPHGRDAAADLNTCQDTVAELRRELAAERAEAEQLRRRVAQLEEQLSMQTQVLYNPNMTPAEALVALSLANEVAYQLEHGEHDGRRVKIRLDTLTKPTREYVDPETGEIIETRQYVNPDATLGTQRSISKATTSRVLERFENAGLLTRTYATRPGRNGQPAKDLYVELADSPEVFRRRALTINMQREKRHGGSLPKDQRPAPCLIHPYADIIVHRTAECAECHAPLGQLLDEVIPASGDPFQHETGSPLASTVDVASTSSTMQRPLARSQPQRAADTQAFTYPALGGHGDT
jgi:hypothetical protein